MLRLILEAALRSLLMAVAVWGGMRIFRVRAVLAQKVAWVLVLLAAAVMPLAMRAPWLALGGHGVVALRIPARPMLSIDRNAVVTPIASRGTVSSAERAVRPEKPSAARRIDGDADFATSTALVVSHKAASTAAVVPRYAPGIVPGRMPADTGSESWNWGRLIAGLGWAYLGVVGILLLRVVAGLTVAFHIRSRSKAASGALATRLPDGQAVRVSRALSTPVTIGSTVILPADCEEWDEAKLRIVLAHELSHVRQRDFYLQLAAAVHVAVFWFSPLGWWLQRRLSELGEALSDRAGLEQASTAASYAQVLLEFAAQPRRTRIPMAGVAMARTSNVSSRIERVLNARLFGAAFTGGRRHALLAAVLVPAVLVAVIAGIRIVPQVETRVEAARAQSVDSGSSQGSGQSASAGSAQSAGGAVGVGTSGSADSASGQVSGQVSGAVPDQVNSVDAEDAGAQQAAPAAPVPTAPPAEPAMSSDMQRNQAMEALDMVEAEAHKGYAYGSDDDGNAFAIVHENSDKTIRMNGTYNDDFEKARKNLHGTYIWFERDGKSYVITDPAVIAKSEALFKGNPALDIRMKTLNEVQANLNLEMAKIQPKIEIKLDSPEIKIELDKLQVELKELDKVKIKEITDKVNLEVLEDLQSKMGDIQGQIGEIQGKIEEKQGLLGEKQGEIGERMGKLGEEMGKIGERQGKIAEEASRKMKSVLDQAIKDGKAKPVE